MHTYKMLICAAALSLISSVGNAATIYATDVVSYERGTVQRVDPGRDDPSTTLGAADGSFFSLGFGGEIVLSFGKAFKATGVVFEETWGNRRSHKETADVYASKDGVVWTLIASLKNYLPMNFSADGTFNFLKIVDTSNPAWVTFDGFDVDAVAVSPVPVPAAGLLLGGALLGFGALRRRKQAA